MKVLIVCHTRMVTLHMQFGNWQCPPLHCVHFGPTTLVLQLHFPFLSHVGLPSSVPSSSQLHSGSQKIFETIKIDNSSLQLKCFKILLMLALKLLRNIVMRKVECTFTVWKSISSIFTTITFKSTHQVVLAYTFPFGITFFSSLYITFVTSLAIWKIVLYVWFALTTLLTIEFFFALASTSSFVTYLISRTFDFAPTFLKLKTVVGIS